jgi:hypothetical protein
MQRTVNNQASGCLLPVCILFREASIQTIKSPVDSRAMIQGAVMCPGRERAVKILHVTWWIIAFETWSGKPEPGITVVCIWNCQHVFVKFGPSNMTISPVTKRTCYQLGSRFAEPRTASHGLNGNNICHVAACHFGQPSCRRTSWTSHRRLLSSLWDSSIVQNSLKYSMYGTDSSIQHKISPARYHSKTIRDLLQHLGMMPSSNTLT